jgi:hypothetical protein
MFLLATVLSYLPLENGLKEQNTFWANNSNGKNGDPQFVFSCVFFHQFISIMIFMNRSQSL